MQVNTKLPVVSPSVTMWVSMSGVKLGLARERALHGLAFGGRFGHAAYPRGKDHVAGRLGGDVERLDEVHAALKQEAERAREVGEVIAARHFARDRQMQEYLVARGAHALKPRAQKEPRHHRSYGAEDN